MKKNTKTIIHGENNNSRRKQHFTEKTIRKHKNKNNTKKNNKEKTKQNNK